jgi:hypothetical protein
MQLAWAHVVWNVSEQSIESCGCCRLQNQELYTTNEGSKTETESTRGEGKKKDDVDEII